MYRSRKFWLEIMEKQEPPSKSSEFSLLGRGILRTAFRDIKAMVIMGIIGALAASLVAVVIGTQVLSTAKIGLFLGFMIALFFRSTVSKLFEYEETTNKKDGA